MAMKMKKFTSKNTEGKNAKFFPPKKALAGKAMAGKGVPAKGGFPMKKGCKGK